MIAVQSLPGFDGPACCRVSYTTPEWLVRYQPSLLQGGWLAVLCRGPNQCKTQHNLQWQSIGSLLLALFNSIPWTALEAETHTQIQNGICVAEVQHLCMTACFHIQISHQARFVAHSTSRGCLMNMRRALQSAGYRTNQQIVKIVDGLDQAALDDRYAMIQ